MPEGEPDDLAAPVARGDLDRLRALLACEGFAGTTRVRAGVCTWTRRINYRGPAAGTDAGALRIVPDGLLETGIHDDYEELWARECTRAPAGIRFSGPGGRWLAVLWTPERFALGRGRPADAAPGAPALAARVERALADGDEGALAAAFDQEFCVGRVVDGAGVVEHSTLPGRRGAVAVRVDGLRRTGPELELPTVDIFGTEASMRFRAEACAP